MRFLTCASGQSVIQTRRSQYFALVPAAKQLWQFWTFFWHTCKNVTKIGEVSRHSCRMYTTYVGFHIAFRLWAWRARLRASCQFYCQPSICTAAMARKRCAPCTRSHNDASLSKMQRHGPVERVKTTAEMSKSSVRPRPSVGPVMNYAALKVAELDIWPARVWVPGRQDATPAYKSIMSWILQADSDVEDEKRPGRVRASSHCRRPCRPSVDPTRPNHVPHSAAPIPGSVHELQRPPWLNCLPSVASSTS